MWEGTSEGKDERDLGIVYSRSLCGIVVPSYDPWHGGLHLLPINDERPSKSRNAPKTCHEAMLPNTIMSKAIRYNSGSRADESGNIPQSRDQRIGS